MFGPKLKIDKDLYERLQKCSEIAGYSSVDEFIRHIMEKAVSDIEEAESEDDVKKRLQGLGYID